MNQFGSTDVLQTLYREQEALGGVIAQLGIPFSPVFISGDVANPGVYNLPSLGSTTTEAVTNYAAGLPVSDTYTGVSLWNVLNDAGGVGVTAAKNDMLSKQERHAQQIRHRHWS